jgi:hypothetical protein
MAVLAACEAMPVSAGKAFLFFFFFFFFFE